MLLLEGFLIDNFSSFLASNADVGSVKRVANVGMAVRARLPSSSSEEETNETTENETIRRQKKVARKLNLNLNNVPQSQRNRVLTSLMKSSQGRRRMRSTSPSSASPPRRRRTKEQTQAVKNQLQVASYSSFCSDEDSPAVAKRNADRSDPLKAVRRGLLFRSVTQPVTVVSLCTFENFAFVAMQGETVVRKFDMRTREFVHTFSGHTASVNCAVVTCCGTPSRRRALLLTGSAANQLTVYDAEGGDVLHSSEYASEVLCVACAFETIYVGLASGFCVFLSASSFKPRLNPRCALDRSAIVALQTTETSSRCEGTTTRLLVLLTNESAVTVHSADTGLLLRTVNSEASRSCAGK